MRKTYVLADIVLVNEWMSEMESESEICLEADIISMSEWMRESENEIDVEADITSMSEWVRWKVTARFA